MIVGRVIYAAKRGFAVGHKSIKHIMYRIASDGKQDGETVYPVIIPCVHFEHGIMKSHSERRKTRKMPCLRRKILSVCRLFFQLYKMAITSILYFLAMEIEHGT